MQPSRKLKTIVLLSILILLSGCTPYSDSIHIESDGSGEAELDVLRLENNVFATRFSRDALSRKLPPEIKLEYSSIKSEGGERIHARYSFGSIDAFVLWAQREDSPFGNISLLRKGNELDITRRFQGLAPAELDAVQKSCGGCTLSFSLSAAGTIVSENSTRIGNGEAAWEVPAPALFENGGKTLSARIVNGESHWPAIAAIAAVLLCIAMFWNRRRKRS